MFLRIQKVDRTSSAALGCFDDPFRGPELAGNIVVTVPSAIFHETPGGHLPAWDEPEQRATWIRTFPDGSH